MSEIKQHNLTLVWQVEELESCNWGLSVKHTQECVTLQCQINEQAEISVSQETWIGSVEHKCDGIDHLINEEHIACVHTTAQLENVKAKLAENWEECKHPQDGFGQDKAIINILKVQLEEEQHTKSRVLDKAHKGNEELCCQLSESETKEEVTLFKLDN